MSDDGVVGVVLTNERYQRLLFDAASCETARRLADDFDARIQRLTQERDDMRRQLAERDEREREAEAHLPMWAGAWREVSPDDRERVLVVLRDDGGMGLTAEWGRAIRALEALATAPATAIAAVLPATAEDAAERALRDLQSWTVAFGHALCPTAGSADTFSDGMREAKRQVSGILARAIAHDRQQRGDEKYLRCEACGHEEGEPFAPGDSHAGCDGPLLCVTCGTGIATSRAEPDEATIMRLWKLARAAFLCDPSAGDDRRWRTAIVAVLGDLAATSHSARRGRGAREAGGGGTGRVGATVVLRGLPRG